MIIFTHERIMNEGLQRQLVPDQWVQFIFNHHGTFLNKILTGCKTNRKGNIIIK